LIPSIVRAIARSLLFEIGKDILGLSKEMRARL
jgi:hypothetical protein